MQLQPFERSYWVLINRLIAGEIPAANNEDESKVKLAGLVRINTKVVINLMEQDERNRQGQLFFDYSPFLEQNNVTTYRIPIKDLSVPSVEKMAEILNFIDLSSSQDKIVYVHCWGGVGRTGTVVGCYMMRHGMANSNNVFDTIDYLKRTTSIANRVSPETIEQREFVLEWRKNQ